MVNLHGAPGIIKHKDQPFYLLRVDTYWLSEDLTGLEEIKASEYA